MSEQRKTQAVGGHCAGSSIYQHVDYTAFTRGDADPEKEQSRAQKIRMPHETVRSADRKLADVIAIARGHDPKELTHDAHRAADPGAGRPSVARPW